MSTNDKNALGAAATIGSGLVTLHGITSKKWEDAHTIFVIVGICIALASFTS